MMNVQSLKTRTMLVASLVIMMSVHVLAGGTETNVKEILSNYLKIKDALVKTDYEAARMGATELVAAIGSTDDGQFGNLKSEAREISQASDINIQRKHFDNLSEEVYNLLKQSSETHDAIYRQYCPMAFNHAGAYWLSKDKEINNPYFGDKMLHCGMTKEEL